jgi:hypothetical protein
MKLGKNNRKKITVSRPTCPECGGYLLFEPVEDQTSRLVSCRSSLTVEDPASQEKDQKRDPVVAHMLMYLYLKAKRNGGNISNLGDFTIHCTKCNRYWDDYYVKQ